MSEDKAICFISFISRDDQPLYIQSFDKTNDEGTSGSNEGEMNKFLKYNFLSHMALDIITSPASLSIRENQLNSDSILLLIQDDVSVYGYETNTGIKIIIGFDNLVSAKQGDVNQLVKSVYKNYIKAVCNPFGEESTNVLQTPSFDKSIAKIVNQWNELELKQQPKQEVLNPEDKVEEEKNPAPEPSAN